MFSSNRWTRAILGFSSFIQRRLDRIISKEKKEALAAIILYTDSPAGHRFDKVILWLIVTSVAIVILETMPGLPMELFWIFFILEWVITVLFTIEYILRIYVERNPLRYIFSFYGMVDLLSFLPSYISVWFFGTQHLLIIRVLRLLRIFRIFKLGHFVTEGGVVVDALKASRIKIYVFLSFIVLMAVLIGTTMYIVEHPYNSDFVSIPSGIYWAIVTITTVGYGDVIPVTTFGRFLATIVMILGYGVLAVPTGIVTAEISNRVVRKHDTEIKLCRNCGETRHVRHAKFCHTCGVDMEHHDQKET